VPKLNSNTALAPKVGKDFQKPRATPGRKSDGLVNGVNDPSQNLLDGGPRPIALQKLLDRDRLLPRSVEGRRGAPDFVNNMPKDTVDIAKAPLVALGDPYEIINKDIHMAQWLVERLRSVVLWRWGHFGKTTHGRSAVRRTFRRGWSSRTCDRR
jgi:hypothetical protein